MFSLYGRWRLQDMSLEFCLSVAWDVVCLYNTVDKRVTRSWCQRRGIDSDFWLDSIYISAISRVLKVVQVMSIHLTGCQRADTSKGNERWMVDNRMGDKCCYWRLSFSILPFSLSVSQWVPSKWHSCKLKSFSVCVCVCWCTEDWYYYRWNKRKTSNTPEQNEQIKCIQIHSWGQKGWLL